MNNMTINDFMSKHNLTDVDFKNLLRYERVRQGYTYDLKEYESMMITMNSNGGKRLLNWINTDDNYEEFLQLILYNNI